MVLLLLHQLRKLRKPLQYNIVQSLKVESQPEPKFACVSFNNGLANFQTCYFCY